MRRLLLLTAALLPTAAVAQVSPFQPVDVSGQIASAIAAAQLTSPILGIFTLATMPKCDSTRQAKYAFVTDLGGGADMTLCDGSAWKHIRLGSPATIAATSGTVTLTPLASAPINIVNGNVTTTLNLSISTTGLYDGEVFYFRRPGLLTGSIGISMAGGTMFPLLGNSSMMLVYSAACTCLVQVQ